MEDNLNYKKFKEWVGNFSFRDEKDNYKFEYIVGKIEELIPETEIETFYPQYLFNNEKDSELLFFTKSKIFLVTGTDRKVFIAIYDLKDVLEYNLEIDSSQGFDNAILNIYFTLDRHLIFNSENDTNASYRSTFVKKIKNIYKLLNN